MVAVNTFFLIIGLIAGVWIGLRTLIMFWFMVGAVVLFIKIPLLVFSITGERISDFSSPILIGGIVLAAVIGGLLWVVAEFGEAIFLDFSIADLPEGIDRVFGGAVCGALGWLLATLMF